MEPKTYNIRINGIDLIERQLLKTNLEDKTEFNFDIKAQSAVDEQRKLIIVLIETAIRKLNDSFVIARIVAGFGFQVEDFESAFSKDEKGVYTIPSDLENLLKSISISTMRGIMFSELRGTLLHNAIMPVITMDALKPIDDNIISRINERK